MSLNIADPIIPILLFPKTSYGKKLALIFILFFGNNQIVLSQTCPCTENLEFLNSFIQKNYVGFEYKKNTIGSKNSFDILYDSLYHIAAKTYDVGCIKILQTFVNRFKDPHLTVSFNEDGLVLDKIIESYQKEERTPLSYSQILARINSPKNAYEDIVGIWEDDSKFYRLAIFPEIGKDNTFLGVYIKGDSIFSFPGQIKMRIKKLNSKKYISEDYFDTYHVKFNPEIKLENNVLNLRGFGNWYKINSDLRNRASTAHSQEPSVRKQSNNTILLTLPSFNIKYKNKIDNLLKENKQNIRNTKYLIIDLRGNSGGSNYSFENILPFIYTNPIPLFGAHILPTDSTINYYIRRLHKSTTPDQVKAQLQKDIEIMEKNKNRVIELWKNDTLLRNEVYPLPKKIAIIIDRNTGSSAEHLLLRAKYSNKVKIFGENSAGAVDFGDVNEIAIPCSYFVLGYPTTMGNNVTILPLDNNGLTPDVKIALGTRNWVQYITNILEKK